MKNLIASRLNLPEKNVKSVLDLLDSGATIPFIARYRKELTGSMNEVSIADIEGEKNKLTELESRKKTITDRLDELENTDQQLRSKIAGCYDPKELEDIYLPFKPKRVTRASKAISLGLEPLAKIIMAQRQNDISAQAVRFAKNEISADEALSGARDIIAEWISESSYARNQIRRMFENNSTLSSKLVKKKEAEASKYKDYFDFSQHAKRIPSHRFMAISRAETEGLLKMKIEVDETIALEKLERIFVKSSGVAATEIKKAAKDSLKRLLSPSLASEYKGDLKAKADKEAIDIFSKNLSQLLMASPLGSKSVLALDPGFRTGCKLVSLNKQTDLLDHGTIYPHPPQNRTSEAADMVLNHIQKYGIQAIAVGNGTAGRETERFVKSILPASTEVEVYSVNESGASIYSASEAGREEFPDLDLTVRGSISIGRRLVDPLAELVKIDPKSIGVGQYQHDVDQGKLKTSLDNTVSFVVNQVGVNLNTSSKHLLQHVSGIGPKLAQAVVNYRSENGPFGSKKELQKVKGLGAKAYEQCAGFLRIKKSTNPLDSSGVHPEAYPLVKKIAAKAGLSVDELMGSEGVISKLTPSDFITDKFGLPTVTDILKELKKPGLDPRGAAKTVNFDDSITSINDLRSGMTLIGKVTNLTKFGAFVDIGIKENGLIHKSQIADRFVEDPSDVLRLDQEVTAKVLEVDLDRKRIQLTLKGM